jgi:hypothetical protein
MATTRRTTSRKVSTTASRAKSTSTVNARSFAQAQTAWKKAEAELKALRAQQQEFAKAFSAQNKFFTEFFRQWTTQFKFLGTWSTGSSTSSSRKTRKPASKSRVATRKFTVISGAKRSVKSA